MTVQPDHIRFYHPAEDGPRTITLISEYTEDTIPNDPVTDVDEAESIIVKHVTEFIAADTEDPTVRWCCLVADLGRPVPQEGFYELIDTYRENMTPDEAERWKDQLRDYSTTEETA